MQSTCTRCGEPFAVSGAEREFLNTLTFTFGGQSITLPSPVLCPACRLRIRASHRNERFLYKTQSALDRSDMVSIYHPAPLWGAPYAVFSHTQWHSDAWDAMDCGRDVDFSRSFFEQWAELHKAVPRMGTITVSNENSEYTTGTAFSRNCYLINSSEYCEDCLYGKLLQNCKNCVDCSFAYDSQLCYDCINIYHCYGCTHTAFSNNCNDCSFSTNLTGCSNCLLCSNLVQKTYCIRNVPVSKEEFAQAIARLRGSHAEHERLQEEWKRMERERIHRHATLVRTEECTGDYVENSKHCVHCFDVTDSEDCEHVYTGVKVKDNFHCSNMYLNVQSCFEVLGAIDVSHSAYCLFCFYSNDLLYCEYCLHCKDCFGCNGLKRKRHCVFNKQYTDRKSVV